jgi:hypothetical protein
MFGERGRSEFGAGKYVLIAFALIALEFVLCRFLLSRVFLDTQSNCALQCIAFAMKNQLTQTRMLHLIQTPKKCKNVKNETKRLLPSILQSRNATYPPSSDLRSPKRMCLGIKHPLIQTNHIIPTKHEVKILQRLRRPETLHLIFHIIFSREHAPSHTCYFASSGHRWRNERHVAHLTIRIGCAGRGYDGCEHVPCVLEIGAVASDAVHYEDGLDGFGA